MKVTPTAIPEVLIIKPKVFIDARGFFMESFNQRLFKEATGVHSDFVQENQSRSGKGVLRGLHYQLQQPQGKLVRVLSGAIFDVAVDLRVTSPTFGQWTAAHLTADNFLQLWVPAGFAHGFLVVSESADVHYKTTDYYAPAAERCLRWDDPTLRIQWPHVEEGPVLSEKDQMGLCLAEAELFTLQPSPSPNLVIGSPETSAKRGIPPRSAGDYS